MEKVKIYSTPTCPYCNAAKEFLTEEGIEFENIDVSQDKEAAEEMVKKSGQMGVPVIIINDEVIVGFDKEKIKKLLNK
jgi:glutaredoxin-like YruB-family protein